MDHFIGLANKYVRGRLSYRIVTENRDKYVFRKMEKFPFLDTKMQAWEYFGTKGVRNKDIHVLYPLAAHNIGNIANNAQKQKIFYDRVCSDMITKEIEG